MLGAMLRSVLVGIAAALDPFMGWGSGCDGECGDPHPHPALLPSARFPFLAGPLPRRQPAGRQSSRSVRTGRPNATLTRCYSIAAWRSRSFSCAAVPLSIRGLRRVNGWLRRVSRGLGRVIPLLPPFLFAAALIATNESLLLAAVLLSVPSVAAPVHSLGLNEGEQLFGRYLVHLPTNISVHRCRHAPNHAEHDQKCSSDQSGCHGVVLL